VHWGLLCFAGWVQRNLRLNVLYCPNAELDIFSVSSNDPKYGQEKSDLLVVAMKPANKPGRLGADLVEPRERTEGEHGRATHVPDSEPNERVPEA
jgi:hypothetical protein